jgi:hypothetical protein
VHPRSWWLAKQKRQLSALTNIAALRADAAESALCGYLSWICPGWPIRASSALLPAELFHLAHHRDEYRQPQLSSTAASLTTIHCSSNNDLTGTIALAPRGQRYASKGVRIIVRSLDDVIKRRITNRSNAVNVTKVFRRIDSRCYSRSGRSHRGTASIVSEITETEKVPCSNAGEFDRSRSYALPTNYRAEAF